MPLISMKRLTFYSVELYKSLEKETGQVSLKSVSFHFTLDFRGFVKLRSKTCALCVGVYITLLSHAFSKSLINEFKPSARFDFLSNVSLFKAVQSYIMQSASFTS